MKSLWVAIWIALLVAPLQGGVEICLKNGDIIKGRLILENANSIQIRILGNNGDLQTLTYPKINVKSIQNVTTDVDLYEERALKLTPSQPELYLSMGAWCAERNIAKARDLFIMAGALSVHLRKDACVFLARSTKDSYTRYSYLRLALWYDPLDISLRRELRSAHDETLYFLYDKRKDISKALNYIIKTNYKAAYQSLEEINDEGISNFFYDTLGYSIHDLLNTLMLEIGGSNKPCPTCDGSKCVECDMCKGKAEVVCKVCGGDGIHKLTLRNEMKKEFPCRFCRKGLLPCPACSVDRFGNGKISCPTCLGLGVEIPKKMYEINPLCDKCKGKGGDLCSSCQGQGRIVCKKCRGIGKIVTLCPDCMGDGYIVCPLCNGGIKKWRCGNCRGLGKLACRTCKKNVGILTQECPFCKESGYTICSVCEETKWCKCVKCKGSGRLQGTAQLIPKISSQLIEKIGQFCKELEKNVSLPPIILEPKTNEAKTNLFCRDERCVFYDGQWMSVKDKENKTNSQILEDAPGIEELKAKAMSLEIKQWADYFATLSSMYDSKLLSYDSLLYRTTFFPSLSADKSPWFYIKGNDLYFGFASCDHEYYSFKILGIESIPLENLKDASPTNPENRFVVYYLIPKVRLEREQDNQSIKLKGWIDMEILGWEMKRGDKTIVNWCKE